MTTRILNEKVQRRLKAFVESEVESWKRLNNIWDRRTDRIDQAAAAKAMGYSGPSSLSNRLNAITPVDEDFAIRFAKLMKVSPLDVMPLGFFSDEQLGKHLRGIDAENAIKQKADEVVNFLEKQIGTVSDSMYKDIYTAIKTNSKY